jgi:zinc protease
VRNSIKLSCLVMLLFSVNAMASEQVHESFLDNGLKLIVKEDHRAPVVVSQVWYKVGSSYEHLGITGISHALEHMMFKGTAKYGPGEFSRIISKNGGKENAFTGQDFTGYYQRLEADKLELSFKMESDRMQNLLLNEDEFKKEIEVIKEERRMRTDDKPQAKTQEIFNAAAWMLSPYGVPIIGWMNDLDNMKIDQLAAWYKRWYAPNNATIVVVGDVDSGEVAKLAKQYFGGIAKAEIKPVKMTIEPEQLGEKRLKVKVAAKLPYLIMGYKVPVINTVTESWEPYALDVLAGVLDGGDSARFSRQLVRGSEVAISASAGYSSTSRMASLFTLSGVPSANHSVAELESALKTQIQKLHDEQVSESELSRVKAQVIASDVFERDSVFYQAMQMGILEVVGVGWRMLDDYVDNIKSVTAEQVQVVAKKYLIDSHLTVAEMEPLPIIKKEVK